LLSLGNGTSNAEGGFVSIASSYELGELEEAEVEPLEDVEPEDEVDPGGEAESEDEMESKHKVKLVSKSGSDDISRKLVITIGL